MSETLTQFGTSFQSKIIASLISNIKFTQTITDILEPKMFDSDSNKWLVKAIREYYFEYKKQPTLEASEDFPQGKSTSNKLCTLLPTVVFNISIKFLSLFVFV